MNYRYNVYRVHDDGGLTMETGCSSMTMAVGHAKYSHKCEQRNYPIDRQSTRVIVRESPVDFADLSKEKLIEERKVVMVLVKGVSY